MRIVKVKLFTVLLILIICISNSFPSIISERLKNASIKEQVHTNITTFLKNYEVHGYLEDVSSQEQSDVSINKSKLYDKVEVLFFPVDGKADNIDTSFFTSHDIKYINAESLLQASVPVNLISELETISGVEFADISDPVKPMEVISEGRNAINATKFVLDGVDGSGVKIAVIDNGFRGYVDLQNHGELPLNLITADFAAINSYDFLAAVPPINPNTGDNHGCACAEIIHDIVPRAEMHLLNIGTDIFRFLWALQYCAYNGIKVVSSSVGENVPYSFISGGGYLDEYIDNSFSANNFLLVTAAGNGAASSWFGSFQNSGRGTNCTIFPNGTEFLDVNAPTEADITLIWDDYGSGNSSYDIIVCDKNGTFLERTNFGGGSMKRVTFNKHNRPNRFKIKICQKNDVMANGRDMRLIFSKGLPSGYVIENPIDRNPESSLCMPADSRCALTVGAVSVSNYSSGPIAYYSSRGPTRATGRYPQAIKPEVVSPTGVSTASVGYRNFAGTSAATPHVAAVAALLLSLSTGTTVSNLKDQVIGYTKQIQTSTDNNYGYGKIFLNIGIIPQNDVGDFVCYPNPSSISEKGYIKITNLPFNTDVIDIDVYTVTGEFVKSFNAGDLTEETYAAGKRRMVKWDLKNQDGRTIAPGVYFVTLKTLLGNKQVKKIAIKR